MSTAGIDYGLGQVNVDHSTGIRYGVIHSGELGQSWYDRCEWDYEEPHCSKCGSERLKDTRYEGDWRCLDCGGWISNDDDECYPESPIAWYYDDEGYTMEQGGDDCDIFITRSPYFTYCAFCSPCAPGAGYLLSQLSPESGIRAYCPGPEWFEEYQSAHGGLPIVVYRVDTGRIA